MQIAKKYESHKFCVTRKGGFLHLIPPQQPELIPARKPELISAKKKPAYNTGLEESNRPSFVVSESFSYSKSVGVVQDLKFEKIALVMNFIS